MLTAFPEVVKYLLQIYAPIDVIASIHASTTQVSLLVNTSAI